MVRTNAAKITKMQRSELIAEVLRDFSWNYDNENDKMKIKHGLLRSCKKKTTKPNIGRV